MADLTNMLATGPRTHYSSGEGNVNYVSVQFDVGAANLALNDVYNVVKLPADASIIYAAIETGALDSGTAVRLDLGITGTQDALIADALKNAFTAATDVALGPQSADYDVFVTVATAPTTPPTAPATETVRVDLAYIRTATVTTGVAA